MSEDPVIQTFTIECKELLQDIESGLLYLENSSDDKDAIDALFRAVHTIKGSSGIVGFDNIERFTHKVENVLERVRQGEVDVADNLIELLLKCRDHIANLLNAATQGDLDDPSVQLSENGLLQQLDSYLDISSDQQGKDEGLVFKESTDSFSDKTAKTDNWHISLRFGIDVLRNGMDPISFISYLSKLGEVVSLTTLTDTIPAAEEMDPESCYLGFEIDFKSDFDKQTIEDVFEFVREDCKISILPPLSEMQQYVHLIHDLPKSPSPEKRLGEMLINGGALTQSELKEALQMQSTETASFTEKQLQESNRKIGEILIDGGMVHPSVVDAAVDKQEKQKEAMAREAKTIRVDTGKLDQLVNLVGELVISNANIAQHAQRIEDVDFVESTSTLSRLVEEIRVVTMQVRMIPIGEVFSRFYRVVRDISYSSNKKIELVISGGETELDKNLIEKINDPLMHLVRNAVDHGIELPDARAAKGKPDKGTIHLNAFQEAGSIVIKITDDGDGLNKEKILRKAIERGVVASNQSISDKEIYRLIFEPGLSTAEKVTKVSGRGVGMDVVKRNIDALRGSVDVESQKNIGTTIQIRLPLTLAIIDGFMVRVGNSFYIIPLDMVVECTELSEAEHEVAGKRKYVNLRDEVLPYLRLRNFFSENGKKLKHENIVVVQSSGQKMGLVVDELRGEIQAVIKSLGKVYKDVNSVSGATILGDGTVALILDVPSLIKTVENEH